MNSHVDEAPDIVRSENEIPWESLRARVRHATSMPYAPYSHVTVGAAGITSNGRIVEGANVENASFGLTLCAECSLISDLVRQGGGRLAAVSIGGDDGEPMARCGRCRQLIFEHGGKELFIDAGEGERARTLLQLLPDASVPDDLGSRRNA